MQPGQYLPLNDPSGRTIGILHLTEKYTYDKKKEAVNVYRTDDEKHPGVAVVSESTATADYREKVAEYQAIGIPEYWIVDPDPFGAAKYIGSPKRPTVSVYQLVNGNYEVMRYQGNDAIVSPTFPELNMTVEKVLNAGR